MNRLQLLDLQSDERQPARPRLSHQVDYTPPHHAPAHRFFIPLHYEKNYAYPLLVWLHGPTSDEGEINQVMPHLSLRNHVAVSTCGVLEDAVSGDTGRRAYTWEQMARCIEHATEDVLSCIELAKARFNIRPERVFLVGNDVGGTMALRLALSFPERFAGVVSIGGCLPVSGTPLSSVQRARSLPVLLIHGRDSDVYPVEQLCLDLRLLHSAGMAVTVRQYPCEQAVTTQMLADTNTWVMEQIAAPTCGLPAHEDPTHLRLEDYN